MVQRNQTVRLIADGRTQGAKAGTRAYPPATEVESWLKRGWKRVDPDPAAAVAVDEADDNIEEKDDDK